MLLYDDEAFYGVHKAMMAERLAHNQRLKTSDDFERVD